MTYGAGLENIHPAPVISGANKFTMQLPSFRKAGGMGFFRSVKSSHGVLHALMKHLSKEVLSPKVLHPFGKLLGSIRPSRMLPVAAVLGVRSEAQVAPPVVGGHSVLVIHLHAIRDGNSHPLEYDLMDSELTLLSKIPERDLKPASIRTSSSLPGSLPVKLGLCSLAAEVMERPCHPFQFSGFRFVRKHLAEMFSWWHLSARRGLIFFHTVIGFVFRAGRGYNLTGSSFVPPMQQEATA